MVRPARRSLAVVVLVAWAMGIVALARSQRSEPPADLLATGALRLEPGTYFYLISQNGRTIGYASSGIDTVESGFTARDMARVRSLLGDSGTVTANSTAYLSRRFAMDSFTVTLFGGAAPIRLRGIPPAGAGVLLPTLAPVALMLGTRPDVGTRRSTRIYNPVSRQVEEVTLTIAAESLFRVVDSARFDSAQRLWVPSHSDTVRAWKVVTPTNAISAWVDSQGRIVSAEEPGGSRITRTAYELATLNEKKERH